MPTECERSVTSPGTVAANNVNEIKQNLTLTNLNEDLTNTQTTMEGDMSTSQTSTTSNGSSCNGGRKTSITSPDPTAYVAKARVTRPTPPPPPYNPMQFVQIKPCNLYQTAQEQLKKAEEVKKIKEIRKEEPEDWQNNLDNWKSSRRKRVEHIIDRVVEVKKLELEEHDRTRRKSKTFSEMMEERGERSGGRGLNKLASLAVYTEDEANDLSDLGIGTSSASGKSSLSEDYDNNSVMSDNAAELDKAINSSTHNKPATTDSTTREYISSPGYETSSSTAPASSPDPCEYTYEGAIQDYKQRVSRAASGLTSVALNKLTTQQQGNSKESTPERPLNKETAYPPRRGSKIEDRLMGFEVQSPSEECVEKNKVDVPKIDISKRKEIFESSNDNEATKSQVTVGAPRVTLRDRFKVQETNEPLTEQPKKELKRLSGDITSIKERLQSLEQQQNLVNGANGATKTTANKLVDIPVPPLKERLSSLQNAVTKEEVRKPPVVLVDARQLEIMKSEEEKAQMNMKETKKDVEMETKVNKEEIKTVTEQPKTETDPKTTEVEEIDRDDSGIHTADDVELEERNQADKLNAAIEALAKEEKQLSEAANAVNQIEAEFEELSIGSVALPPLANSNNSNSNGSASTITNDHMEYSVSSTNPTNTTTISYSKKDNDENQNNNENINNDDDNNIKSSSSTSSNCSGIGPNSNNSDTVKGLDFKSASNLRRKPTNEMVHAKNLLKIFKETFQNDIELDEQEDKAEPEVKNIREAIEETPKKKEDLSLNIKTQVFENSNVNISPTKVDEIEIANKTKESLTSGSATSKPNYPATPMTPSMIPRGIPNPLGKPPMSPKSLRANAKFMAATPPGSPSFARKNDSQFSINGRVEIFNSKTMTSSPTSPSGGNFVKPLTPTMTTKKIQMPYINAPKTTQSNNIVLPTQHNMTQQQDATTKSFTVIEPLSTTTATTTAAAAAETTAAAAAAATTARPNATNNEENNERLKSMPSQQMVNEPQTKLDGETYHHQQQQQQPELVKQQQQQRQQNEIVICAPPITIVNPDELPKPNTVKNLSSCFQQQQDNNNNNAKVPLPAPKPLPRSRIPQITPPPSPILPRRHICYSSETISSTSPTKEPSKKLSPSSTPLEDEKKLSIISTSSTSTPTKVSPSASPLEEDKKLSLISSSSTSSTSTGSTVIDTKKLSLVSNASSLSEDVKPSFGETQAQVHKEPEKPKKEIEAKVLDKDATQALVDEMIKADKQARTLILDTKNMPNKIKDSKILPPLKIDIEKSLDEQPTTSPTPLSPSLDAKQEPKTASTSSPISKPFTSPLASLNSPTSELFKTTTPLVVSTLYDKYHPTPSTPNNQETPLALLKSTTPTTPAIIIPAELPNIPDCPPNESSLYKIASAPHSPTSPKSPNSEKNLALDAALCNSLLTSLAVTPNVMQRQYTVEEELCEKVDKETLPFHKGSTGFKDISKADIKKCDGLTPSTAPKLQIATQRQRTVEEELCQKLDVNTLPDDKQQPITGYKSVSPTDIRKCDNFFTTGSAKPSSKPNSKPSSPIMQAREAHSKALIETCEKIIAEERMASNQLKSSLPSSPTSTPLMQRKSKLPKPITSCCKATESLNEADLKHNDTSNGQQTDNEGVIARMHVVETQIKVTTTTPPASPKNLPAAKSQPSPQPTKKTKNIFDFLKKNFGVGGHSHKEEGPQSAESMEQKQTPPAVTETTPPTPDTKVLVLSEQELKELEKVQYDEIHNIDNSKFYVPTRELEEDDEEEATPPPLPKTPAPVNIEITRKIITNEIVEDGKSEQDITKEIDELLDDELNKLNQEIEELEKAGRKQQ